MLTGSFADRREGKAYRKEGWFMGRRVMQSRNAVNQEIQGGISVCASLNVRPQYPGSSLQLQYLWARDVWGVFLSVNI